MATTEAPLSISIELQGPRSGPITEHESEIGLSVQPTSAERQREEEAVALHPVDEGFHAWLFVFSAFVLECIVWGFPFRFVSVVA